MKEPTATPADDSLPKTTEDGWRADKTYETSGKTAKYAMGVACGLEKEVSDVKERSHKDLFRIMSVQASQARERLASFGFHVASAFPEPLSAFHLSPHGVVVVRGCADMSMSNFFPNDGGQAVPEDISVAYHRVPREFFKEGWLDATEQTFKRMVVEYPSECLLSMLDRSLKADFIVVLGGPSGLDVNIDPIPLPPVVVRTSDVNRNAIERVIRRIAVTKEPLAKFRSNRRYDENDPWGWYYNSWAFDPETGIRLARFASQANRATTQTSFVMSSILYFGGVMPGWMSPPRVGQAACLSSTLYKGSVFGDETQPQPLPPTGEDPADEWSPIDQESEGDPRFQEGRRKRGRHSRLERDPALRKAFLAANPKPRTCEACLTNLTSRYPWTEAIQVHHLLPLSSDASSGTTSLHDVAGLCPSCHVAIHSFYDMRLAMAGKGDFESIDEARTVFETACESIRGLAEDANDAPVGKENGHAHVQD